MAIFVNKAPDALFSSIEFFPFAAGKLSFFHLGSASEIAKAKAWLTEAGQHIIAETEAGGQTILVAKGNKTQQQILSSLEKDGEKFAALGKEKKFNPWKWRGNLSNIGQVLQLASAKFGSKGVDTAMLGFASLNLIANFTNILFGAEKAKDPHRLHYLKETFNERLSPHLADNSVLPSPEEHRASLRKTNDAPKSLSHRSYEFIQRNSVRIGEIGLRYVGSLILIFPVEKWKGFFYTALHVVRGDFKGASNAFGLTINADTATRNAGIAYVTGKSLAFFAKAKDDYNPAPKSLVDKIREKVLFRASTAIEFAAAGTIAYDRATNPKRKITIAGKTSQDYLGALGGTSFMAGFGMRFNAPVGIKEVDMQELSAHISDSLMHVAPDKLPQALADSAGFLKEHFKDKPIAFGKIFTDVANDLYSYHAMSITSPAANPGDALLAQNREAPTVETTVTPVADRASFQERFPRQKSNAVVPATKDKPLNHPSLNHTSRLNVPATEGRML